MQEERRTSMQAGIVVRESPGVTRWAARTWKAVALIPGAPPADWAELRREGGVVEYHAATVTLTLHRTDTEAYVEALASRRPSVAVVMRPQPGGARPKVALATASPYEAQDYLDSGEEIVDPVPMPDAVLAWVRDFVARHHAPEPFVKRKRRNWEERPPEDGRGDPRIAQASDVYRAPTARQHQGAVAEEDPPGPRRRGGAR